MAECEVLICGKDIVNKKHGLCEGHLSRKRNGDLEKYIDIPLGQLKKAKYPPKPCMIEECDRDSRSNGYCKGHYSRSYRGKDVTLPIRDLNERYGPLRIDNNGYVVMQDRRLKRVVRHHIVVMQENIGRKLLKGESVHHKNGIRHDNRLENLELWSRSQPAGQRVEDKVQWAKEILHRYERKV